MTPHLLDIDGDICHHVHNIAKMFTKAFDGYLEKLFQDIFSRFQSECRLVTSIERYLLSSWYILQECLLRDAYVIFYYFIDGSTRKTKVLNNIFKKLKVSQVLKEKKLTKKGKERKKRIVDVLLLNAKKVSLISSFYEGVLPVFKEFMCFQSSKPLIHKVYYRQIELLKQFLSFMKPSVLANCTTGKKLLKLKISESNLLNESMLFVGQKAKHIIRSAKAGDTTVQEFLASAAKAYKTCGEYAQNKLPLQNKTLKSLTTIDPDFILLKMEVVLNYLLGLSDLLVHVLGGVEKHKEYDKEVRKLMFDNTFPACTDENGDEVDMYTGGQLYPPSIL